MKKVIRAQVYVPWKEPEIISLNCEVMNKELEGWPIYYDCFEGEYGNDKEHICCFEVNCEADTYKEAEEFYDMFKRSIRSYFGVKPKEIIKMKLERVI